MTVPTPDVPTTPNLPTTDPNVPAPVAPDTTVPNVPTPGTPNPADPSLPTDPTTPDNTPVGAPAPGAVATPAPTQDANPDVPAPAADPNAPAPEPTADELAGQQDAPEPSAEEIDQLNHRFDDEEPHSKTVSQVANEVINGAWGDGNDRRDKLARAGYNYDEVQAEVNAILHGDQPNARKSLDTLSDEVISGKWGNGAERERRLIEAGYSAQAVQVEVNRKLKEREPNQG